MLIQKRDQGVWEDVYPKKEHSGFGQLLLLPQSASKGDALRILTGGDCPIGTYRIIEAVKGKVDSALKAFQEKQREQRKKSKESGFEGIEPYDNFELEISRSVHLEITEITIEMMTSPTVVHIETKQR